MIVRSFLLWLSLRRGWVYLQFLLAHGTHLFFQEPLLNALAVEDVFTGEFIDLLALFEVVVAN